MSGRWVPILVAHLAAFLATVLPIWRVSLLPFVDYPNHLARMHILHSHAASPALQDNYLVQWGVVPYLGMDAVILPLLSVTDIYTAGQVFVVLAFALTAAGVVGLQWVSSRSIGATSFLVYPLLYSTNLGWGFVPFVFGVGLGLCLLCGVLALQDRSYPVRLGFASLAFTAMYLCHLLTLGIFALLVACVVTAKTQWFSRDFFARGLEVTPAFLPSVALWTLVPPFPGGANVTEGWFSVVKLIPMAVNGNYTWALLAMLPIAVGLYVGVREGALGIRPGLGRALLVVGLLALVVPERLFNVGLVGLRLPYVWLLLLAAAVDVREGVLRQEVRVGFYALSVALFGARHVQIAGALADCDAKLVEFREATRQIPVGATRMSVYSLDDADVCGNVHWVEHVNALAVIERDAFVPNLFMKINAIRPTPARDDPGYHVVLPTRIEDFFPGQGDYEDTPKKMREWRENFDYIADFHRDPAVVIPDVSPVEEGSWFRILRVDPGATAD